MPTSCRSRTGAAGQLVTDLVRGEHGGGRKLAGLATSFSNTSRYSKGTRGQYLNVSSVKSKHGPYDTIQTGQHFKGSQVLEALLINSGPLYKGIHVEKLLCHMRKQCCFSSEDAVFKVPHSNKSKQPKHHQSKHCDFSHLASKPYGKQFYVPLADVRYVLYPCRC